MISDAIKNEAHVWLTINPILLSPHKAGHTPVLPHGHPSLTQYFRFCIENSMTNCELIELKDLSVNDPIELAAPSAHTGQPGLDHIVRLVGDCVGFEGPARPPPEGAVGHDFQPYSYTHLTWCDLCGEFIWGLYKQSLRCAGERFLPFWSILRLSLFWCRQQKSQNEFRAVCCTFCSNIVSKLWKYNNDIIIVK